MSSFSLRQRERFSQRAADQRAEAWRTDITYRAETVAVVISGLNESRNLEAGGFQQTIDATMRIRRSLLAARPEIGDTFTVIETGLVYKIGKVIDNPRCPEWIVNIETTDN